MNMTSKSSSGTSISKKLPHKGAKSIAKKTGRKADAIVKDKSGGRLLASNDARETRILMDIFSQSENIAHVLAGVLAKVDDTVPGAVLSHIKAAQEAARNIHLKSRAHVTCVARIPYAVKGYDRMRAEEAEERMAMGLVQQSPVGKLRAFNAKCRTGGTIGDKHKRHLANSPTNEDDSATSARRSKRVSSGVKPTDTPFSGLPPHGKKLWSREDIVAAVGPYEGKVRKARIMAILRKKKTHYQSVSAIYRMLKKCENGESPRCVFECIPIRMYCAYLHLLCACSSISYIAHRHSFLSSGPEVVHARQLLRISLMSLNLRPRLHPVEL